MLLVIVASAVGVVLFEYSRHRIGEFCALLVATLLLFLGPGWNDIMQPFQIAWLIAVGAGVLALSLLDRRRPAFDAAACVLITISLASTSVGVALAVGIAVDIALSRRRWRDAWIVGLPLALYVVWAVHYHSSEIQFSAVTNAPIDLAQTTTAALAGLVGLSGVTPTDVTGLSLAFGVPLFALAAAVVIVRSAAGWDHTRWLSLAAALVTFSLMTTLVRSFQSPFSSRYMYVTCALVALIGVELVAGVTVSRRSQAVLGVLTLVAVISNIAVLRSGGGYFRQAGAQTDATLAAVALDRATVSAQTPLTQLPLYPVTVVTAGQYFTAADALGTPAYSVGQLLHASPAAQASADAQTGLRRRRQADVRGPRGTVGTRTGDAERGTGRAERRRRDRRAHERLRALGGSGDVRLGSAEFDHGQSRAPARSRSWPARHRRRSRRGGSRRRSRHWGRSRRVAPRSSPSAATPRRSSGSSGSRR